MSLELEVAGVSKRFGGLRALDSVSLRFEAGEVHAVLGENGAGKSTLVNIASGFLKPDAGEVLINGVALKLGDPFACRHAGIGVVHQHFALVPNLTVAENLALVRLERLGRILNVGRLAKPALDVAARLGWNVDPSALVRSLPVGAQQRVEILKSLGEGQRVLLFDEPTAPLGPDEVADLLRILRELASEGRVVVLIAHKLSEVLAVADRISILRRGKVVAANMPAGEATPDGLAELMVGELPSAPAGRGEAAASDGLRVESLHVKGDRGEPAVRGASFVARQGEIVGIGGVDGNGQLELAEALAGIREYTGRITFQGGSLPRVAYVPADRHGDGLAMGMTVGQNLLLGRLTSWPKRREAVDWARVLIQRYAIKVDGPATPVADLSGGNQQKVVVARSLDAQPEVVVVVNPTRGLDVRATRFVHDQLRAARDRQAAVVLVSADLDELFEVADRVLFLSRGELSERHDAKAVVGT